MAAKRKTKKKDVRKSASKYPIEYWSHSSLSAFLRNQLSWYKRYVKKIYDTPRTPSSVVGSAAHVAMQHFYSGASKEIAMNLGMEYLRNVPDFELNFGKAKTKKAMKAKRASMEREYTQAVTHYLERPPRHKVLGVEVGGTVKVPGLPLPLKAISDLVVESKVEPGAVDVVDHKFVDFYSSSKADKPLFIMQAIFNYYTVREMFGRPVRRFIVFECKKSKNADGKSQLRKYVLDFKEAEHHFEVFHRLIIEATEEISRPRRFLPNPSDMFEGEHSFELYRLRLLED